MGVAGSASQDVVSLRGGYLLPMALVIAQNSCGLELVSFQAQAAGDLQDVQPPSAALQAGKTVRIAMDRLMAVEGAARILHHRKSNKRGLVRWTVQRDEGLRRRLHQIRCRDAGKGFRPIPQFSQPAKFNHKFSSGWFRFVGPGASGQVRPDWANVAVLALLKLWQAKAVAKMNIDSSAVTNAAVRVAVM
ncbi:hypothetical protein F66182_2014 [Fusarium sp. NRRL 66182]|nr:hypothetical protein F66182_2014 [Fusarium sp. NRRL 66182]